MRVMVIVKADSSTETGALPSEELLTEMGRYNEELSKAGSCWPVKACTRVRKGCA